MTSADDAQAQAKRPTAMARQSSAQSHRTQSPPDGHTQPAQHKAQRHVVGRVQRNTSFGKNLNKLTKVAQQAQQAQQTTAEGTTRHHRRSQSGDSVSAPSSPRPGIKRNASSGGNVRANRQGHTQANLRKNHSSGHLARQGHIKHGLMRSKSDLGSSRRALGNRSRSHQSSPEPHATVHFDVDSDDEEGGDDGWTEESASQSPTTTRSNTRSNSVILEAQHKIARENMENNRGAPAQVAAANDSPTHASQALADRTRNNTRTNGGSSQQHARPPDAEIITSRLLQRSASHNVAPPTSSTATTAVSSMSRQTLNHSGTSTLVDAPGTELVSRFMDGDGSAGASHEGGYLNSQNGAKGESSSLDKSKRNQSMPNVSGTETPSKTPQRSGTTTPTNLPPSRTQQKLMLQRASSNIEPQKLVPVTLPRSGGPAFLSSSVHYNADGEGRLDPRLQQYFNHVAVEYNVVRRYRNPLADALGRILQTPGFTQKKRAPRSTGTNGVTRAQGSHSLSGSFHEAGIETDGLGLRRSRVSFDNSPGIRRTSRDDGDSERRQSFESDHGRGRNEADEICRRLWESAEVVEGD